VGAFLMSTIMVLPFLMVVLDLWSVMSSEPSEGEFVLSAGGILLRQDTNAGKHLFPYLATLLSLTILVVACLYLVQNGSAISSSG